MAIEKATIDTIKPITFWWHYDLKDFMKLYFQMNVCQSKLSIVCDIHYLVDVYETSLDGMDSVF